MLRVGVDLIDNIRVQRAIERHGERFFTRFLTEAERVYCGDRAERIAARIAAKEAVGKALGTGIGDVRWRDIEIIADERGRPILALHGAAQRLAEALGVRAWDISLSHTASQSIAFVVGLIEDRG